MTGGIGSGKTEAAKIFSQVSVPVIDLDDIAHQITQNNHPGYIALKECFGDKYLDKNSEIIRNNLKKDIFNSEKVKKKVESILHPLIFDECKKQISQYKTEEYIVIVIALLFETQNYLELIDESLYIDCEKKLQITRVASRDKLEKNLIQAIIKAQSPREQKIKQADRIISNNLSKIILKSNILQYHNELMAKLVITKND